MRVYYIYNQTPFIVARAIFDLMMGALPERRVKHWKRIYKKNLYQ